jgi:hypothetical protein
MKVGLACLAFLCALGLAAPANASQSGGYIVPPSGAQQQYKPQDKYAHPIDPVLGYRSAEDVVFSEVSASDLPAYIRSDLSSLLGGCEAGSSVIKAYSYVSSYTRAHGLSPNYVIDFSKLTPEIPFCSRQAACNADGCVLIAYQSGDYEQWSRAFVVRDMNWGMKTVDAGHTKPLAILDIGTKCPDGAAAAGDGFCHAYRIWLATGFGNYTLPQAN